MSLDTSLHGSKVIRSLRNTLETHFLLNMRYLRYFQKREKAVIYDIVILQIKNQLIYIATTQTHLLRIPKSFPEKG